jgi:hypothetical protein
MTIVGPCHERCLVDRAVGDVSVTAIRGGDTVKVSGEIRLVKEITTDYLGKTGIHMICGRRVQMAAALLVLEGGDVIEACAPLEKICPDCGRTVVRFR